MVAIDNSYYPSKVACPNTSSAEYRISLTLLRNIVYNDFNDDDNSYSY